jgi:hypothetical protein
MQFPFNSKLLQIYLIVRQFYFVETWQSQHITFLFRTDWGLGDYKGGRGEGEGEGKWGGSTIGHFMADSQACIRDESPLRNP